jgi:hypothetical protein
MEGDGPLTLVAHRLVGCSHSGIGWHPTTQWADDLAPTTG